MLRNDKEIRGDSETEHLIPIADLLLGCKRAKTLIKFLFVGCLVVVVAAQRRRRGGGAVVAPPPLFF
ncbi:hypothetical protein, partial [Corynebacterium sp.]|uniref:hypothetical protein n=1 Tax=Corynebacterium sp. TaxID=1720 RepID=UPI0026DCD436